MKAQPERAAVKEHLVSRELMINAYAKGLGNYSNLFRFVSLNDKIGTPLAFKALYLVNVDESNKVTDEMLKYTLFSLELHMFEYMVFDSIHCLIGL